MITKKRESFLIVVTYFNKLFNVNIWSRHWSWRSWLLGLFFGSTSSQIGLMLFALGVGQITALIVVQSQTQLTFVRAQVIAHKIWILENIDCLEGKLFQAFTSIFVCLTSRSDTTTASLGSSWFFLLLINKTLNVYFKQISTCFLS